MNNDQIKGRAQDAKGKIKEATGKAIGNDRMRSQGQMDQATGKVQSQVGDAKEAVKRQIDKL